MQGIFVVKAVIMSLQTGARINLRSFQLFTDDRNLVNFYHPKHVSYLKNLIGDTCQWSIAAESSNFENVDAPRINVVKHCS